MYLALMSWINSLNCIVALQEQFAKRYSPAYVVSETQPASQEIGDYWFKVTGTVD